MSASRFGGVIVQGGVASGLFNAIVAEEPSVVIAGVGPGPATSL